MFQRESDVNTNSNNNGGTNSTKKAAGFLNVYLPSQDGGKVKLGAITLYADKPREKALFDALNNEETAERALQAVIDKLIMDFNPNVQSEGKNFDLGL